MSGFLYRNHVRDAINHAAVLGRIDDRNCLVDLSQSQSGNAGLVAFQPPVLALNQRDSYLFWLRHVLVSVPLAL